MKFQNPDTNQIFVDICDAYTDFCNSRDCDTDCPLDAPAWEDGYQSCSVWAIHHPVEAARLMGYEVLGDDFNYYEVLKSSLEEAIAYKEGKPNDCSAVTIELEEANMDKPRICEVLGVEVDEEWNVIGDIATTYRINQSGRLECAMSLFNRPCRWKWQRADDHLADFINNPDRIVRKPRWTEKEVEAAKAILTLWPDATILEDGRPYYIRVHGKDRLLNTVDLDLFPNIQPGQSVKLSEICGGIHDFD